MKCSQTKSCKINGMINVLDELMVTSSEAFSSIRVNFPVKGLTELSAAYQLYCSAFIHSSDVDHFKDELLSHDFGLPVVLFPWNGKVYVVLKSKILDILFVISNLLSSANEYQMKNSNRKSQLSKKTVQQFIKSMDSEHDEKVVKACFTMLLSRTEMERIAIKPDISTKALREVSVIANEVERSYIAGEDILKLHIKEQINKLEKKIEQVTKCIVKANIRQSNNTVMDDLQAKQKN